MANQVEIHAAVIEVGVEPPDVLAIHGVAIEVGIEPPGSMAIHGVAIEVGIEPPPVPPQGIVLWLE